MHDDDPEQLADTLENEADRLERHSDEVKQRIKGAREDWERKRRDDSVPGAAPPESDEEPAPPEASPEG